MRISRAGRLACVMVVGAVLAAGCSDDSGSDETEGTGGSGGGSLVLAYPAAATVFDPHNPGEVLGSGSRVVIDQVFDTLLKRTVDGGVEPSLAVEMPAAQDDGSWRFSLREGVTFSNGEPFNADSVVHSVERIIDPEFASGLADFFVTLTGATKVDEHTVDITTDGFDSLLPARMTLLFMVPVEGSEASDFAQKPIGTGPYVLKGTTADGVELMINPDYWGDEPSISSVKVRFIEDAATSIAALEAGEIDIMANLPPDLAGTVRNAEARAVAGQESPLIELNSYAGITADVEVRKALNLAVDKEALAEQLFSGYAEPAKCQVVPPSSEGHADDLEPYAYDPDTARQMLEDAGVAGDTIQLFSSTVYPNGGQIAEVIASYWEEVGLSVDLQVLELESYVDQAVKPTGADAPAATYVSTSDELFDATRGLGSVHTTKSTFNRYTNPIVDAAYEEALTLEPGDERNDVLHEALQEACDDAAAVFLLSTQSVWGVATDVDFSPRPDGELFVIDVSVG